MILELLLSCFPAAFSEGFAVVVTKDHYSSYIFALPDQVISGLTLAARDVAQLLDEKLEDVGRTGMIFEGFGVNHAHAKLFPMHGTDSPSWEERKSSVDKYFDHYEGYISSHDYVRADDDKLEALAKKLRGEVD